MMAFILTKACSCNRKTLFHQRGVSAGPGHVGSLIGVVVGPITRIVDQRYDVVGAVGEITVQPFNKEVPNFQRQTQHDVLRRRRHTLRGFHLAVVERRDHGCGEDGGGDFRFGQS